jgi:hypothetical protein
MKMNSMDNAKIARRLDWGYDVVASKQVGKLKMDMK